MIYLDNAATSYPKPDNVYVEMARCMKEYCANPGRGGHYMSIASINAVSKARENVSRFFNISDPMQLCFTKNATEALNIAIRGSLKAGDHVVTTSMEHNSVIRPLKTLEKNEGVEIAIVRANSFGEIDPEDIRRSIKRNTKLIVCTISSNVNGAIMPVKEIGRTARNYGIAFLVDGAQGAGSVKIDVEDMCIDMLAFPGHKGLLGPQGTGGLYIRSDLKINPLMQGGTGSNSENLYQPEIMPDLLESGTLNTPGIVGLNAGIEFINAFGLNNLILYKNMLLERLIQGIEEIKGIKMYNSHSASFNSGIVAVNVKDADSTEISYALDRNYKIATRAGLHCAPLAHETLGTMKRGIVRFSIGCFNSVDEIDIALNALREISASI